MFKRIGAAESFCLKAYYSFMAWVDTDDFITGVETRTEQGSMYRERTVTIFQGNPKNDGTQKVEFDLFYGDEGWRIKKIVRSGRGIEGEPWEELYWATYAYNYLAWTGKREFNFLLKEATPNTRAYKQLQAAAG